MILRNTVNRSAIFENILRGFDQAGFDALSSFEWKVRCAAIAAVGLYNFA